MKPTGQRRAAAGPWPWMRRAVPVLAALAGIGGGCAHNSLDLGRGGLPADDDARWSLALAQARSEAPQDRLSGLVYESRPEPAGLAGPELALTGEADSLTQGFQTAPRSHLRLSVYLDKSTYTRGYLKVSLDGAAEETWPFVAYQLRGDPGGDFQFTYLAADPAGALRTFMLIGGGFRKNGDDLTAIEGALFLPAERPKTGRFSPAAWRTAYPVAFVRDEPRQPAYDVLAARSVEVARDLERLDGELDRVSKRLEGLRTARNTAPGEAAQPGAPPPSGGAAASATPPDEARRADLQLQLHRLAEEAQANAIRYFELRGESDSLFAAYLTGNAYRWRDADGRREAFARWAAPDRAVADFDGLIARLLPYVSDPAKIEQARASYTATVARNRNSEKRPPGTNRPG